jgi:hypothetical protein
MAASSTGSKVKLSVPKHNASEVWKGGKPPLVVNISVDGGDEVLLT